MHLNSPFLLHLCQATDPDISDQGKLFYSLLFASPYFDVDSFSGLLYVVSAESLAGQSFVVEVRATDPGGLNATTRVEVGLCVCIQQQYWRDAAIIAISKFQ